MNNRFKKLTEHLAKLPGIGPRQAVRLALDLVEWPSNEIENLAEAIKDIKAGPILCKKCFNFSDGEICEICASLKRDQTRIAVVEKVTDLQSMEKSGTYQGVYHVLGGSINPVEGVLPEKLKIRELMDRASDLKRLTNDIEIIIATNPNTPGETTALYLENELKPLAIKVTRLARGLSSGSTIEYADDITLANAMKHRK